MIVILRLSAENEAEFSESSVFVKVPPVFANAKTGNRSRKNIHVNLAEASVRIHLHANRERTAVQDS